MNNEIWAAYQAGKKAREDGLMLNANPYVDRELCDMWRQGWKDGTPKAWMK